LLAAYKGVAFRKRRFSALLPAHPGFEQHVGKTAQLTCLGLNVQETFRSFLPAARTSSTVLEVEFHPEMSPRPGPLEQGALESPKKLEELDRQEEVLLMYLSQSVLAVCG